MSRTLRAFAILGWLLALAAADPALAQKSGGILRIYHRDSPASMSIHEEGTIGVIMPMMGVFNNLVVFDQNVAQNSLEVDRSRPRDELGVERGRQGADLQAARGRQMA